MAVAVVRLAHLAARAAVIVQHALGRGLDRFAQDTGCGIVLCLRQELKAFTKGAELAQTVPTQVVFTLQLLHMFRGRAACTRLKQTTALHQLYNRQHLGRCRQFKDGEEIGQVIAQHIACDGDMVLTCADRF